MTANNTKILTTNAAVAKYEMLYPLLTSLLFEMKELSKKKQDGIINKLKAAMINRLLRQVKDLLTTEPTSDFIDLLDEDTLPTNSDAVLIMSQYQSALHHFHDKYYRRDSAGFDSRWYTAEHP